MGANNVSYERSVETIPFLTEHWGMKLIHHGKFRNGISIRIGWRRQEYPDPLSREAFDLLWSYEGLSWD